MARTDSLTNYLTDLGTALREKTGTSDLIPANTFDTVITNIQTKEDLTTELITQDNLITNQEITIDNIVLALQGKGTGSGITPTGEITITENGTYDVTNYASANVNVPSIQDTSTEDALVTGTITGDYVNNRVTSIGGNRLRMTKIISLHCEEVLSTGSESVRDCGQLTYVYLPKCTTIGVYTFGLCTKLEEIELNSVETISAYSFYGCSKLTKVIIKNTAKICSLSNTNAFNNTPIANGTGYVYVPDDLVDSYKAATNWSTFANQIKGLSELSGPPVPEPGPTLE